MIKIIEEPLKEEELNENLDENIDNPVFDLFSTPIEELLGIYTPELKEKLDEALSANNKEIELLEKELQISSKEVEELDNQISILYQKVMSLSCK